MFIVVSVLFHKNWTIRAKGNKIKLDGFIIDIGCPHCESIIYGDNIVTLSAYDNPELNMKPLQDWIYGF